MRKYLLVFHICYRAVEGWNYVDGDARFVIEATPEDILEEIQKVQKKIDKGHFNVLHQVLPL